MKKSKKIKVNKCKVEDCTKNVKAKSLCSIHYKKNYKIGILKGVYALILNDEKIYIGTSIAGIEIRIERHKTSLVNNNKKNAIAAVLEYFNELCDNHPNLTRNQVWDTFVRYEIIEATPILLTRSSENGFNFNAKDAREGFMILESNKEIVQKTKKYWESVEDYYISLYQELDRTNGTSNCLNKKRKKKESKEKKGCI